MVETIIMKAILYATCDMTDSLFFETLSPRPEHTGGLTDLIFNFTERPSSSRVDNLRYSSSLFNPFRLPRTSQTGIARIFTLRLKSASYRHEIQLGSLHSQDAASFPAV